MTEDGYPTEEELDSIRRFEGSPEALVELVRSMWWGGRDYVLVKDVSDDIYGEIKEVRLVTVGWSGNEDIIEVLSHTAFNMWHWYLSKRGGLHVYRVPVDKWTVETKLGDIQLMFGQKDAT